MTIDILKKYIWILQKLYLSGGMTYKELMEYWEISPINDEKERRIPPRTFYNYKEDIQSLFGITINCNHANNKYYIEDDNELKKNNITNWLLNAFSVSNIIQESQNLKDRIQFEEIPSGNNHLMLILEAMQEGKRLRLTYQAFYKEGSSTYIVEPYCVKVFRQRWYMIAANTQNKKLYTYALDRLLDIAILDEKFKMPQSFNMENYFRDWFGIIVMPEEYDIEKIRLKVYARHHKRDYLLTLPLHVSQKEVDHKPDYSVFEYETYPTEDFFQEILSHGSDVEIISPQWVRDEMKCRSLEMYKLYKTNSTDTSNVCQ